MTARRPRIGITMRIESEKDRFYLGRDYSEAVEAAGGLPIHICLIPHQEFLTSMMDELDGVLLPGSDSDVDPSRYGREPHQGLGVVQPLKDETDLIVLEELERRRIPLLAICFGMQILNVFRGGTLIQDIATELPNALKHEQGAPRDRRSHALKVQAGSQLAMLAGSDGIMVNSHHHQGIDNVGNDLVATAWTSDGLVEGLEDSRADRFVLGVQWHPEMGWQNDEFSTKIFHEFVGAAEKFNRRGVGLNSSRDTSTKVETGMRV